MTNVVVNIDSVEDFKLLVVPTNYLAVNIQGCVKYAVLRIKGGMQWP